MSGEAELAKGIEAIADELAGIREALEELCRRIDGPPVTVPAAQRQHHPLCACWCGDVHSIAKAIALNAAIDITQPEEGLHGD